MLRGMPLIRRRARNAEPPDERLPDLEFLALVRDSLEEQAPGVTEGTELKGNSLVSPHGWAVAVLPPDHGSGHHYDLAALPDVKVQPDVPMFVDCSVAMSRNPKHAADAWVQTSGACLLELFDRRGRFADHADPSDEHGVPGWHVIASGVVGMSLDPAENRRIQAAILNMNVLHRIAPSFTADLESPFFNGVKMFYGGAPGAMQAEIRVNGEYHEAASAAMAALGLPEPKTFTAVRSYALFLPLPAGRDEPEYPSVRLELSRAHAHGPTCGCGNELDSEHPGFEISLPHLIAELPGDERAKRVHLDTGVMMAADGIGNFLKVRLPIQLEDGRTLVYLAWVYLQAPVIEEVARRGHALDLEGHRFEGLFCNAVGPWGEELLQAPVVLQGRPAIEPGAVGFCDIVESSHPLLSRVIGQRWPAELVLGDRDPRKRGSA